MTDEKKDPSAEESKDEAATGQNESAAEVKPDEKENKESSSGEQVKTEGTLPKSKKEIRDALNKKPESRQTKGRRKSKIRENIRRQLQHSDIGSGDKVFPSKVKVMIVLAAIAILLAFAWQFREMGKDKKLNIYQACLDGNYEAVQKLLGKRPELVDFQNPEDGSTPLHFAAKGGNLAIVRKLIELRAGVGKVNAKRRTPIHYAAESGHAEIVKLLCNKDALTRLSDTDGMRPIHLAASNGHADVIEVLLNNRADPNDVVRDARMTALHFAALHDHLDAAKVLLAAGAEPNTVNNTGYTPLHIAVLRNDPDMVELLLTKGAGAAVPRDGRTALDVAKDEVKTAKEKGDDAAIEKTEKILELLQTAAK